MDVKRLVEFCNAHDCDNCPLLDDEMGTVSNCGLVLFAAQPEIAEDMVITWEKEEEKNKIAKRKAVYVIYDKYFVDTIYGVATSEEMAIKIVAELGRQALKDCLAVDSEDSGIHWNEMNDKQKAEFYKTQIKSSFVIKEMKLDCYICDGEVHAI